MKWASLSKEQKQKAILAGLLGLALLSAAVRFGLGPVFERMDQTVARRDEMLNKMDKGQRDIRSESKLEAQVQSLRSSLAQTFADLIPPTDNALSWATKFVNAQTRRLGLPDASISEIPQSDQNWLQADQAKRAFKPYAVRVEITANFDETKKLVRSLHESSPYVTVAGMMIAADSRNHDRHAVELRLEWPAWKDAKQGESPFVNVAPAKEKDHGKGG